MPSSRLRVGQYLPFFRERGIEATILPALPDPWFTRFCYSKSKILRFFHLAAEVLNAFRRAFLSRFYDVVFIQKGITLSNFRGLDRLFSRSSRPLVFDLDDSVFGLNAVEFRFPWLWALQDKGQTIKIARRANAVIAGNAYLKDLTEDYNANVFVIPTPVDTERILPEPSSRDPASSKTVIGWLGVPGGLIYFDLIAEALQRLAKRYPLVLRIVSRLNGRHFSVPGVTMEYVDWDYACERRDLNAFDIGIAPMADDHWAKGKCSLKLLQYMAAGLPTVSSRSGMNQEVVEDGVDGFLAEGTGEWFEKLSRLIGDIPLRKKMGEKARLKVVDHYSLKKNAERFSDLLFEVGRS